MTKEQEEAIERLENLCEYGLCYTINEEVIIAIETVLNMLKEQDKEIEKKDKIIDLMAKRIGFNDVGELYYYDIEEIKQYFERKVEEC